MVLLQDHKIRLVSLGNYERSARNSDTRVLMHVRFGLGHGVGGLEYDNGARRFILMDVRKESTT